MKTVIAQFIPNPEKNEDTNRHPQGKTKNIDEGVDFVPFNISPCDFKIIFDHARSPYKRFQNK
jgi:hypothetical protein